MNDIKNNYSVFCSGSGRSIKISTLIESSFNISEKQKSVIYDKLESMRDEIWDLCYLESEDFKTTLEINKREILALFPENSSYVEIENQYSDSVYFKSRPWFEIATNKGIIRLGWRKRVLSIHWDNKFIPQTGYELFPDEDVTRYDNCIHAWSLADAKKYIDRLLS